MQHLSYFRCRTWIAVDWIITPQLMFGSVAIVTSASLGCAEKISQSTCIKVCVAC